MEVPPEPWPNVMLETVGSRVARSIGVGRAAPARVLPGLLRLPRQGSCRGNLLRPSALCGLGLGVALAASGFGFTSVHLPCSAWCAVGATPTVRAQVKGYKGAPLLLYTDRYYS